jgi:peroxiredoxin
MLKPTILFIVVAAAASACGGGELGSIRVGEEAPVFRLANLRGERVSLRDFRRGTTLVNFWASWCDPCKKEVPLLNELQQSLAASGVTIVGVSVEEPREAVDAFVRKHQIAYPVLLDSDGSISRRYGLIGLPLNVIVDREGLVSMVKAGIVDEPMIAALRAGGAPVASASTHRR